MTIAPAADRRRKTRRTAAVLVVITMAVVPGAQAQTRLTLIPSVTFSNVYDDNLFAQVQGDAGHMRRIRPNLETIYESPRLKLNNEYSFDMQHSNFSALNSFDARRHGLLEAHLRASPFTTLGVNAYYDRTETPGELDFETGILGERMQAQRWEVAPSVSVRVRPRTTIRASYDWTTESLVNGMDGTLHVLRAGTSHLGSTRTELTAGYVGRRFVDPIDTNLSHGLLVGWTRELAPATRLTLQAGPRTSTYSGLQPEVVVGLTRGGPRIRLGADYWHGETIILGIRGPVAIDSATARIIFPITQQFEIGTHLGASDSTTLARETARVYRTTLVGSWSPGDLYTISASYGVDYQQGTIRHNLVLDDNVLRHVVRVNLTIAPRISRLIRQPTGLGPAARPEGVTR
jgi:hypothetical protein